MTERIARHPNLTAWAVLAIGMLAILAWSARGMELQTAQWAALGVATVILAGACAWIISWEADDGEAALDPGDAASTGVAVTSGASDPGEEADVAGPGSAVASDGDDADSGTEAGAGPE